MATTPNYNWPTPDDTDLVRDGALAIRTLADDIDAEVFAIQGSIAPAGWTEIQTISVTTGSVITFDIPEDDYQFFRVTGAYDPSAACLLSMKIYNSTQPTLTHRQRRESTVVNTFDSGSAPQQMQGTVTTRIFYKIDFWQSKDVGSAQWIYYGATQIFQAPNGGDYTQTQGIVGRGTITSTPRIDITGSAATTDASFTLWGI